LRDERKGKVNAVCQKKKGVIEYLVSYTFKT
jgi:hypothetical protein